MGLCLHGFYGVSGSLEGTVSLPRRLDTPMAGRDAATETSDRVTVSARQIVVPARAARSRSWRNGSIGPAEYGWGRRRRRRRIRCIHQ